MTALGNGLIPYLNGLTLLPYGPVNSASSVPPVLAVRGVPRAFRLHLQPQGRQMVVLHRRSQAAAKDNGLRMEQSRGSPRGSLGIPRPLTVRNGSNTSPNPNFGNDTDLLFSTGNRTLYPPRLRVLVRYTRARLERGQRRMCRIPRSGTLCGRSLFPASLRLPRRRPAALAFL